MWRFVILIFFSLSACNASPAPPADTVSTERDTLLAAVVNLNIFNRTASIQPLTEQSATLFSANVGDTSSVTYIEDLSDQAFIALSNNPDQASITPWDITASVDIPVSYVVDVTDSTLNANLSGMNIPRFDIVSSNSTVDVLLPTIPFQLAVDSSESQFNLTIPTNAEVQSAQLVSGGGVLSLRVESGVRFIGNIQVMSGGMVLSVPSTSGVQIIVDSATNSEITLPGSPRGAVDTGIYTTPDFENSESQILLNATLNAAAIRIVQE